MHGSTFFSGKFKQDLCGGMIWGGQQHFFCGHFLSGHFSAGGDSACGVGLWGLAEGSGGGLVFLACQARALLDTPRVPISAHRNNVHRCDRIDMSPR
jgi:hypothetical protein